MKKFIFLAAIAATVLASCTKDSFSNEEQAEVKNGMIPYTATVRFDATRSTIDGSNDRKIVWEVGEKVAIFDDYNTKPYKFTVTNVTSNGATIEGMISEMAEKIYGVYPYSAAVGLTLASLAGDSLTVKLPSVQTIESGRVIASDALVTVSEEADPYGGYLLFYNPFSVLKFTIPVDGVKKVVFSGLDGKGVTGNQTIRVDDRGNREIVVKGKSSLTVSKADGFAKGTAYYATVFSRDVAGVRFVLTADDYTSTIESHKVAAFLKSNGLTFNFTEKQINDGKGPAAPEYPEAPELACVKIGDVWWAPVNCGYDASHPYGLLYQWGRKYGQGYDEETPAVSIQESQLTTVAAGSEASNKDNFYCGEDVWTSASTSETDDWFTTYNPCPDGWRVPTFDELSALLGNLGEVRGGWDSTNKGYWLDGTTSPSTGNGLFFPAAGCREYNEGNAYSRGDFASYWSSSVTIDDVRTMSISSSNAAYSNNFSRADGCSVRCVKE